MKWKFILGIVSTCLQLSLSSPLKSVSNEPSFVKRSPPARGGSSSTTFDLPNPRKKKWVYDPSDPLDLMRKAYESASKDPRRPLDDPEAELGPKTLKWINRAHTSLLRDPDMIKSAADYYVGKMARKSKIEGVLRADEKAKKWVRLHGTAEDSSSTTVPFTADALMNDVFDRLVSEADLDHGLKIGHHIYETSPQDRRLMRQNIAAAVDRLKTWLGDDPKAWNKMTKEELIKLGHALNHMELPYWWPEITDRAKKALAWSLKEKQQSNEGR